MNPRPAGDFSQTLTLIKIVIVSLPRLADACLFSSFALNETKSSFSVAILVCNREDRGVISQRLATDCRQAGEN